MLSPEFRDIFREMTYHSSSLSACISFGVNAVDYLCIRLSKLLFVPVREKASAAWALQLPLSSLHSHHGSYNLTLSCTDTKKKNLGRLMETVTQRKMTSIDQIKYVGYIQSYTTRGYRETRMRSSAKFLVDATQVRWKSQGKDRHHSVCVDLYVIVRV